MPEQGNTPQYPHLSAQQYERVEALRAARSVLIASQVLVKTTVPDPIDLVNVARYITTGVDPYEVSREAAEQKAAEIAARDDQ